MLIKTIAEVKSVLPKLVANLNSTSLLPNFNAVEEKYLVPIIGNELYADLQTKYDGNTLSVGELALLKHIRLVIAAYGFLDDLASTHVAITDFGVRTSATESMPKAVGWEYKAIKEFLIDKSTDGTEVLLNYLWKKKADFALWTASDQYKDFQGFLIRTGTDFNNHYKLHQPMRTFYALKGVINDVQYEYLLPALGKELLKYFVDETGVTAEEKVIAWTLKKALSFFTIKRAGEHYNVQFGASGFTIVSFFWRYRNGRCRPYGCEPAVGKY